jgi:hypothetical protein
MLPVLVTRRTDASTFLGFRIVHIAYRYVSVSRMWTYVAQESTGLESQSLESRYMSNDPAGVSSLEGNQFLRVTQSHKIVTEHHINTEPYTFADFWTLIQGQWLEESSGVPWAVKDTILKDNMRVNVPSRLIIISTSIFGAQRSPSLKNR